MDAIHGCLIQRGILPDFTEKWPRIGFFTPTGNITLSTASDDRKVSIRVVDDGIGIAEELRARLFEPLFTTKTRGLGLGLAISQEIVQRHGGEIQAESDPGRGTVVTVSLPVREQCHDE